MPYMKKRIKGNKSKAYGRFNNNANKANSMNTIKSRRGGVRL